MQTPLLGLLLCAGLIVGCTHTREVGYEFSQTQPEEMFRSLAEEEVAVTLEDSRQLEGTVVWLPPDTIKFLAIGSDTAMYLPIGMITSIYVEGSVWGPIVGFLGGGLVGGLIGAEIGKGQTGSDDFGAIDETGGALIGGLFGAVVGVSGGANATAANRYILPPGGIEIRKSSDTVNVQVSRILDETELSITIPWYTRWTTLPKSRIIIEKRPEGIIIRVPRALLYEGNKPRYLD